MLASTPSRMGAFHGFRRTKLWTLPLMALALAASSAKPSAAQAAAAGSARAHYEHGVRLSAAGQIDLALEAFQEAYTLAPHPAVLFNIGQLQLALGRHIEARQSLTDYLRGSTAEHDSTRAQQARRSLEVCERLIGAIALKVSPADAEVLVDGRLLDDVARSKIPVTAGQHSVVIRKPGHETLVLTPTVLGGQVTHIAARIERQRAPGLIEVKCRVPEAIIEIDGRTLSRNESFPLQVEPGAHAISFARSGYVTSRHTVVVNSGKKVLVRCALEPLQPIPERLGGRLFVQLSPQGSGLSLDGRAIESGASVPAGPHHLQASRPGYLPWRRGIVVPAQADTRLAVELSPTPEAQRELLRSARQRRALAYVLGGSGVALGGVAATLFAVASRRHDEWTEHRDALGGNDSPESRREFAQLADQAASIQRLDDLGIAAAVAGTGLLGTALYLLATTGNLESSITTAQFQPAPAAFRW